MCLAVPGRIVARQTASDPWAALGTVDFGGVRRSVSLACVPEAREGDLVLVHAGVAIAVVDEAAGALLAELVDRMAAAEEAGVAGAAAGGNEEADDC